MALIASLRRKFVGVLKRARVNRSSQPDGRQHIRTNRSWGSSNVLVFTLTDAEARIMLPKTISTQETESSIVPHMNTCEPARGSCVVAYEFWICPVSIQGSLASALSRGKVKITLSDSDVQLTLNFKTRTWASCFKFEPFPGSASINLHKTNVLSNK